MSPFGKRSSPLGDESEIPKTPQVDDNEVTEDLDSPTPIPIPGRQLTMQFGTRRSSQFQSMDLQNQDFTRRDSGIQDSALHRKPSDPNPSVRKRPRPSYSPSKPEPPHIITNHTPSPVMTRRITRSIGPTASSVGIPPLNNRDYIPDNLLPIMHTIGEHYFRDYVKLVEQFVDGEMTEKDLDMQAKKLFQVSAEVPSAGRTVKKMVLKMVMERKEVQDDG